MLPTLSADLLCDFCATPNPEWGYHPSKANVAVVACDDGEVIPVAVDMSDWAACDECAKLIDAANLEGLLDRAAYSFCEKFCDIRGEFTIDERNKIRNLHREVYQNIIDSRNSKRIA